MNKYLCQNHNDIIDKLIRLKKLYRKDRLIVDFCNELLQITRYCKKQGQRMENRLYRYKNTIESLGFERIKK